MSIDKPWVLYKNLFEDGTIVASSAENGWLSASPFTYYAANSVNTAEDSSVDYLDDWKAGDQWIAQSGGDCYITVDTGSVSSTADTMCIYRHNLDTAGVTITVESSTDNVAWTERVAGFTVSADTIIVKTFSSVSARYWRVALYNFTDAETEPTTYWTPPPPGLPTNASGMAAYGGDVYVGYLDGKIYRQASGETVFTYYDTVPSILHMGSNSAGDIWTNGYAAVGEGDLFYVQERDTSGFAEFSKPGISSGQSYSVMLARDLIYTCSTVDQTIWVYAGNNAWKSATDDGHGNDFPDPPKAWMSMGCNSEDTAFAGAFNSGMYQKTLAAEWFSDSSLGGGNTTSWKGFAWDSDGSIYVAKGASKIFKDDVEYLDFDAQGIAVHANGDFYCSLGSAGDESVYRMASSKLGTAPKIGVLCLGERTELEKQVQRTFDPEREMLKKVSTRPEEGARGLTSDEGYTGQRLTASFIGHTDAWIRGTFKTMWEDHLELCKPFFFSWNPTTYPNQVYLLNIPGDFNLDASFLSGSPENRRNLTLVMEGEKE